MPKDNVVNVDFSKVNEAFEDSEDFVKYSSELLDLSPGSRVIIIGKDKSDGEPVIGCNYDLSKEEQKALLIYALSQAKWAMHSAIDSIEDR